MPKLDPASARKTLNVRTNACRKRCRNLLPFKSVKKSEKSVQGAILSRNRPKARSPGGGLSGATAPREWPQVRARVMRRNAAAQRKKKQENLKKKKQKRSAIVKAAGGAAAYAKKAKDRAKNYIKNKGKILRDASKRRKKGKKPKFQYTSFNPYLDS